MVQKSRVRNRPFDNKSCDDERFDDEYTGWLRDLTNGESFESLKNGRENDENEYVDDDEDTDPDFENVLRCLKEWGNSYLLEDERDGLITIVKYEEEEEEYTSYERERDQEPKRKLRSASKRENGASYQSKSVQTNGRNGPKSSYEMERDQEPKRKLRSASKRENGASYQSKSVETNGRNGPKSSYERERDQEPNRKLRSASKRENGASYQSKSVETKSRNGPKSNSVNKGRNLCGRNLKGRSDCKKAENVGTDESGPDPDYYNFIKNCRIVDDTLVFKYQGYEIVFWKKDEEEVKHDDDDDNSGRSSSDLEIIDSVSFYKKDNSNPSQMNEDGCKDGGVEGDFRRQVIANLIRPYDQNEYDLLWEAISFCKPKLHHKELRNGRELSCLTDTVGKSYLEHFPDFKRLFYRSQDDKPKCLNLLRGFFFWLKNQVHDGSFKPWQNTECFSLNPGSC